ncbi:cell agglutination protein Mam3 [Cladophialophora chaetospira]|uniref:Cell agglutination protein Mam3 n=1 Tax=Cladophialophora chaetospira TaxID=386627 RepID=A0AA38X8F2_9EURO|nr:cell agglutination protein Mam3 [Cladophialophora chaetospira]
MNARPPNSYLARRPMVLGLAKILFLSLGQLPIAQAAPLFVQGWLSAAEEPEPKAPDDPSLWIYLSVAAVLVLLGGAFAGLTIALMGQDELYLQVIKDSGEGKERVHAEKVLNLLRKGKHWVLVTLLLSNVITNETLPIVLDRSLGGGWPAVLGSTVLIVIFGEIAPQSVCVRYGLPIGAFMAPFVLVLMWILAPVAWPTAKLLDYLLGEDHGTTYKKAGLKTLVSLHRSLGESGQQLNSDEVTIISAVLDLKEKPIGSIMTPMDDVFTLSLDDILDEPTMDEVLSQGYSRIPVHHPDNDNDFVGMLLVKMLITYDPEDAKPVRDFALATLPETRPDTSCLDIVNFFQEGKSHMVLVSEYPGEDHGAIGVVTLEDVIEELIGEEIVDESDVFIDVHKAIRRSMAAPIRRIPKTTILPDEPATINGSVPDLVDIDESEILSPEDLQRAKTADIPPKKKELIAATRRRSSANSVGDNAKARRGPSTDEMKEHLKHLGPSNLASRPRTTRYNTVKIKPGTAPPAKAEGRQTPIRRVSESATEFQSGIGEGLLNSAGKHASDGVQAVAKNYGSIAGSPVERRPQSASKAVQADPTYLGTPSADVENSRPPANTRDSESTIGSLPERQRSRSPYYHHKGPARSGSITENFVDTNGFRKVVLEMTSSSESNEEDNSGANKGHQPYDESKNSSRSKLRSTDEGHSQEQHEDGSKKKKRRRRKHGRSNGKGEREPLLGD